MPRRAAVPLTIVALLATCAAVGAEGAERVYRLGYLSFWYSTSDSVQRLALSEGLRTRGYLEGERLVVERRYADGKIERLPDLAAELVRLRVDVIVAVSTPAGLAAKRATSTIPIVVAGSSDMVDSGLVADVQRPGANVTGVQFLRPQLVVRQMEILKQVVPNASRLGFLGNPDVASDAAGVRLRGAHRARGAHRSRSAGLCAPRGHARPGPHRGSEHDGDRPLAERGAHGRAEQAAHHISGASVRGGGRAHLLLRRPGGPGTARCGLRGQDPARSRPCRFACGAVRELRAHRQSTHGEGAQSHRAKRARGAGRRRVPLDCSRFRHPAKLPASWTASVGWAPRKFPPAPWDGWSSSCAPGSRCRAPIRSSASSRAASPSRSGSIPTSTWASPPSPSRATWWPSYRTGGRGGRCPMPRWRCSR